MSDQVNIVEYLRAIPSARVHKYQLKMRRVAVALQYSDVNSVVDAESDDAFVMALKEALAVSQSNMGKDQPV